MRNLVLLVTAVMIAILAVPPSIPVISSTPAAAAASSAPKLYVTAGVDPGGKLAFVPAVIIIPQVNITLNVTFTNNLTTGGQVHTFTIDNFDNSKAEISTGNVTAGQNMSVEFHINSMTNITYKGVYFQPESSGQGIRWYCIPHRQANMVGQIVLAGLTPAAPEKGILLRAYWIGIIGIAAMLLWVIISYFLIKSSSRHFTDHKEHLRKGLP